MNSGTTTQSSAPAVSGQERGGEFRGVQISVQDLANKLNEKQKEAVFLQWGPSLVIAGAGSGKTTVLTRRVAYLVSQLHATPNSVLCVTFTNKAAGEMKERLEKLVGTSVGRSLSIGTFHSICARFLRYDIESYVSPEGFRWQSNFVIYDETESMSLIKEAIKKLNLDDKVFAPKDMRNAISSFKNDGVSSARCASDAKNYRDQRLAEIFTAYQALLAKNNALDFDDLILTFTNLLAQNQEVRNKYRNRFKHLLVDEFQDTNQSQYRMIRLLSPDEPFQSNAEQREELWDGRSLMVVGDVDQSIYSWRKADFRIILGFQSDFKNGKLVMLEDNYRSNATILDAANSIIKNNSERIDKILRCNKGQGDRIQVNAASDEIDEAFWVVNQLKNLKSRGITHKKCAILYRTNSMSRAIEEVLVRSHVPYTMAGGTRFYERQEIKDALSYLKLVYNNADGQSFLRCINNPRRGIGDTSLDKLKEYAETNGLTMLEAAMRADHAGGLPAKAAKSLRDFALLVERWHNQLAAMSVSDLLEMILKQSGYLPKLEEDANTSKEEVSQDRLDNVRELLSVASEFEQSADEPTVDGFLTRISLVSDLDAIKSGADAVTLMTLHAAKGLEFENVFLMGLEEGLFPHFRSFESIAALEEERRLMYVGVTRAEERLHLSWARRRSSFAGAGSGQGNYTLVSRFLTEITPELLNGFDEPTGYYREPGANGRERNGYEDESGSRFGGGNRNNGANGTDYGATNRGGGYGSGSNGYGSSGRSGGGYGSSNRSGSSSSGGGYGSGSNGYGSSGRTGAGGYGSGSNGYGSSGRSGGSSSSGGGYGSGSNGYGSSGRTGSSSSGSGSSNRPAASSGSGAGGNAAANPNNSRYARNMPDSSFPARQAPRQSSSTSPFITGSNKPGPINPQQTKPRVLSRKVGDTTPQPVEPVKQSIVNANFERLKVGDRVLHGKFGTGSVIQVIGDGDKELYQVEFIGVDGQRVLDPRFAKLVKLD